MVERTAALAATDSTSLANSRMAEARQLEFARIRVFLAH